MENLEKLFFIALVPQEALLEELWDLKKNFSEHYDTKAALRSPPHISLQMPFKWKEKKEGQLILSLENFVKDRTGFDVVLRDYGAFPPRVIFVDVVLSDELKALKKELNQWLASKLNIYNTRGPERPFKPHLTLAFRDLKKSDFYLAWEEFKDRDYDSGFLARAVTLLKHNGKYWDVLKDFNFRDTEH